ncbi:hypothetical protein Pcinc_016978 [Petrolisthes cinctipes]|uniref:Uncharacterized protein n=1 Tax=Petrolisthes cinctipes TaxID=88211 RepID=A0AAE1KN96_PETCI|nr:hypothetical protein Pcinc_016978 [Petrolisthes cinctipes]
MSPRGKNDRLMRWSLSLQAYKYRVIHIAGRAQSDFQPPTTSSSLSAAVLVKLDIRWTKVLILTLVLQFSQTFDKQTPKSSCLPL